MVNKYLFLAYSFVWLIFMLYAWNLSRRQTRLQKELDEVKSKVAESASTASSRPSAS
ncbi:MAG TPA: CcmD family protein [Terriglobia bacterium]|nr:CcmD family protein [Terriglobia bacterium]HKT11641.1 CcmD family protein [Terriglobia bacterium]